MAETTDEINNDNEQWLRKSDVLRWAFDLAFADPDDRGAKYDEALALLDSDGALDRLTESWSAETATEFSDADKNHFREHWLKTDDTAAYLRSAFRAAIVRARDRDVELNAIMFVAGSERVRVGFVDNPNSVTVVIWTPMAPKLADPRARVSDPFVTLMQY